MPTQFAVDIRVATPAEDAVIAAHFYQMWRDNSVPIGAIAPDWQSQIQQYLNEARRSLGYQAFVAEVNDQTVK